MSDTTVGVDPFESLQRYVDEPLTPPRLKVRRAGHRFVADAHVGFRGRVLAAHAAGSTEHAAVEAVIDRLRRQLRRTVMTEVALRNEPRTIQAEIDAMRREAQLHPEPSRKAAEQREIIRRWPYVRSSRRSRRSGSCSTSISSSSCSSTRARTRTSSSTGATRDGWGSSSRRAACVHRRGGPRDARTRPARAPGSRSPRRSRR